LKKVAIAIISLMGLALGGCNTNANNMVLSQDTYGNPVWTPSMSVGAGIIQDWCGQYKYSDNRCNPYLSQH
jgi:outer membrane lipoprotein SlyB